MSRSCLLIASLLLVIAGGCGPSFKTVPVSGRITLDGQPVEEAGVLFVPEQKGPTASGLTGPDGRFTLMTGKLDGAAPGRYRVAVMKEEVLGKQVDAQGEEIADARITIKHGVPTRYGDPNSSGLTLEVKDSTTAADFALVKEEAKKE